MRYFLAVKSYGDTVIACHHLRGNPVNEDVLVCAEHLRPLVGALCYPGPIIWLNNGEQGVPALFDIRKYGAVAATRSACQLRRAIRSVITAGDSLVFDRIGWRQRYLAAGYPSVSIASGQRSIYLDYEVFLGARCASIEVASPSAFPLRIGIFPDSRVEAKAIPEFLTEQIAEVLRALGHDVRIVRAGPGCEVNTFESLISCIDSFAAIVSADSLPAHLAEYAGRRAFVFSPVKNNYWLPKTALETDSYSLFDESLERVRHWAKSCI